MSIRSLDQVPRDVMEQRHYEQIIGLIVDAVFTFERHHGSESYVDEDDTFEAAADWLARYNSNFKRDVFLKACREQHKAR